MKSVDEIIKEYKKDIDTVIDTYKEYVKLSDELFETMEADVKELAEAYKLDELEQLAKKINDGYVRLRINLYIDHYKKKKPLPLP